MKKILLLITNIFFFTIGVAQDLSFQIKSRGVPYIKNYSQKDYKADLFNHDITQDNRGILYFANNTGVLEFDGTSWQLFQLPNASRVYSLTFDENKKRVYVGGVGDFGYLSCDQNGKTTFVSLKSLIPNDQQNFKNVWLIFTMPNLGVVFFTTSAIYIYKEGKIKVLTSSAKNSFHAAFHINNNLYVREWNQGLKKMKNGHLELVSNGNQFANERIYGMLPFDKDKSLIITRTKGLFLYDGKSFTPWNTEVTPKFLAESQVYFSKTLGKQYFAIATIKKGIIILDKQGKVVQQLGESAGMTSPYINGLFWDKGRNLWAAKSEGLSQVILNTPFTFYDKNLGLKSNLTSSAIVGNKAYFVSMQKGFFALPWENTNYKNINKLDLVYNQTTNCFDSYIQGEDVLLGHNAGILVHNTQDNSNYKIAKDRFIWKFAYSEKHKNVFAGSRKGLIKVVKENDRWKTKSVKSSTGSIPFLAFYQNQEIFTSDDNGTLSKITLNETLDSVLSQTRYDTLHGLPSNSGNWVFQISGKVIIATKKGVYHYNKLQDRFDLHPDLKEIVGDKLVRYIKNDVKGNLWIWAGFPNDLHLMFLKKLPNNAYQLVKTPFQKLKNTFIELGTHINPIDQKNVLFGAPQGAIHYDPSVKINYDRSYLSLIRKVETVSDQDSVIFGGNFLDSLGQITHKQPKKSVLKLPYSLNSLRFGFAATYYEDNDKLVYSHYLKGFDPHWSDWLNTTQKEYTNLPEGKYTFMVKARNIYGKESLVASYSFKILPPWHRTVWAYIGYVIITAFLVWVIVKLNIRRLQAQKRRLESVVQRRTAEIVEKNKSLQMQKEELEALNEQIINQKQGIPSLNRDLHLFLL